MSTNESLKGGGGSREYMAAFTGGREDLTCQSCGATMRREGDYGTTADGASSDEYCVVCYADGEFRHDASSMDDFISKAVDEIAASLKQSTGKTKLQLKKELRKLPRWQ